MSSDWRVVTVEDIAAPYPTALATGPFGSAISSKYFVNSGVPVIRGSNLSAKISTRLIDDGLVFLSPEKAEEFQRSMVKRGDLVFTCWGTIKLWTELVARLATAAPQIKPQKPRPQHWLNNAIGRAGFALNPTASHRDDRLGVEVYIHHAESKKMYQALLAQRTSIEQALGFELDWQELPDAHACRIATWRQESPIEDETQWGAYLDWFVQRIVKMNAVFRPVIQALA